MGKSNSKLKKKHRTQSMAWNVHFPSITSLSTRKKSPQTKTSNLSIAQWLNILNLNEYESAFEKFSTIDDVLKYTDQDLNDLGVKNEVHRFQMISSLAAMKTKYKRNTRSKSVSNAVFYKSQRHSLAVEPSMLINRSAIEPSITKILEQSKTLIDVKMEATMPECDSDLIRLKKMLEWELSLDARDLRSHAWYHGSVSRTKAEEIVADRDGDFLVRDCSSQPGNYVLSCRSKGQTLHFVINKIILQPDTVYESVQYRFEEDGFDTVPDLITYYVGSGKPITTVSGAKIQNPCNREFPLSSCYAGCANETVGVVSPNGRWRSPASSPPTRRPHLRRPSRHRPQSAASGDCGATGLDTSCGNHSLPRASFASKMSVAAADSKGTASAATTVPRNRRTSRGDSWRSEASLSPPSSSLAAQTLGQPATSSADNKNGGRETSSADGSSSEVGGEEAPPPPKPSRFVRQTGEERVVAGVSYVLSGSDSGNGSGDSVHNCSCGGSCSAKAAPAPAPAPGTDCADQRRPASKAILRRRSSSGVVIKHPKYSAVGNDALFGGQPRGDTKDVAGDHLAAPRTADSLPAFATSMPQLPSAFDLENFHTLLLPVAENKPLDVDALHSVHALLLESGSRILANHLTRADLKLTVANLGPEYVGCMCKTGIELAMLPHGRQHRSDLIERTECLKLLVATTILTCGTESERAELLNKWIEVAIDAKTALGNLYGFCGIMLGLCTPQVQRLDETWHILRQKYTDSAFNFEAKLRSTLKSMNESTNPLAPNTTIPHLLPILLLYERAIDETEMDGVHLLRPNSLQSTIDQWETSTSDLGLSTWYAHLNSSRHFCRSLSTFRRNAEIVLTDSKIDELLLDMFKTEFHLKFLWGSRGAMVGNVERHLKFEEILSVMSEKCENLYPTYIPNSDLSDGVSVKHGPEIIP